MNLRTFLIDRGREALARQAPDGSFPAGHNGPYGHPERALRNTGHWLFLLGHAARWSGDPALEAAARRALDYCLDPAHRPHGANWWHRTTPGRDRCNGLIGPAWTIEALCVAFELWGERRAFDRALEVFRLHPFQEESGLWKRVEVDGSILPLDVTFNHQLWFAASVARLARNGDPVAAAQTERFLDVLDRLLRVHRSGMVRHRLRLSPFSWMLEPGSPILWFWKMIDPASRGKKPLDAWKRDTGYHAFNLHALAVLRRCRPDHRFWDSPLIRAVADFAASGTHIRALENNRYGYPYNPVGFEMAWFLRVFRPDDRTAQEAWIARQFSWTTAGPAYGAEADDPETARARLYEAVEWACEAEA